MQKPPIRRLFGDVGKAAAHRKNEISFFGLQIFL